MAIISFYSEGREETGNTISALSLATYLGITENNRTLIISTAFKDNTIKEALWPEQKKKLSGLFGPNTHTITQSGIEDLDRMVKSGRITTEIIPNYTRVALKGRLEALTSYNGDPGQYEEIKEHFSQIIATAGRAYTNVIVDVDKSLDEKFKKEILRISDVIVVLTTQKYKNILELDEMIQQEKISNKKNVILLLGKYNPQTKYNAKNITRNLLKQKKIINTIPFNPMVFEAVQEGRIIDVFWNFVNLKNKDENFEFIQEISRLRNDLNEKVFSRK